MKRLILALAAAGPVLTLMPRLALAEEQGPESPAPFNISLSSEYRYRGISQSRSKPALAGGYDFSAANGLYVGTWLSQIRWIKDAGGNANVEWDLYGGYKGEITKDLTYDIGGLYYEYPNNKLNPSANTFELYGALSYGEWTFKYSRSVTNLFGFNDSKGSGYLEAGAQYDLGNGWSLLPHVGHQIVSKFSDASYTDYSLVVGKDLGKDVTKGFNVSAGIVGTNAKKAVYISPDGKALGRTTLVGQLKYNF